MKIAMAYIDDQRSATAEAPADFTDYADRATPASLPVANETHETFDDALAPLPPYTGPTWPDALTRVTISNAGAIEEGFDRNLLLRGIILGYVVLAIAILMFVTQINAIGG